MKSRTVNLAVLQALLAIGLLQALPSRADTNPAPAGPANAPVVPLYVSPGIGILLSLFR